MSEGAERGRERVQGGVSEGVEKRGRERVQGGVSEWVREQKRGEWAGWPQDVSVPN